MIVGIWFVKSFINAKQADFKVLEDISSRKIGFLVNLKYKYGGKIQNGRQTIKCSKFIHKNANYWKFFNLAFLKNIFFFFFF
jgi:hypothetical protein